MKDKSGRAYAKLSELKEGDIVEVNGGFTCLHNGTSHVVKFASDQPSALSLYIRCAAGRHFLDGQLADDNDSLIGIYKVKP